MHRMLSVKIGELNNYLKCPLCKGYLIDSYTINECLHSFCKSCIIKYIKRKECCPICKINIIKDRMNLFLKRDVNLQCVVYKLVPDLFKREMKRRRDFYSTHPKALKHLKKKKILDKETLGQLEEDIFMLDQYTDISLSIEYSDTGIPEICDSARYKELDPPSPKSYLQCPASLTIELLKKFISVKLGLKTTKNLDVMYDDKPLSKDLTLVDVAYIYAWRRTAPMRLFYRLNKEEKPSETCSVQNNVLAQIDNKLNSVTTEPTESQTIPSKEETNKLKESKLDEIHDIPDDADKSINKPTAKSTPQKEQQTNLTQDQSQSRLNIDLSITNESVNKENCENFENSFKNNSTHASLLHTQSNTTQNLISNSDNLTITAMVASITKSSSNNLNKLETVSNSDKENEDESHPNKPIPMEQLNQIEPGEINSQINAKPKKPKNIKPKKETNTEPKTESNLPDEGLDLTNKPKKKASNKSTSDLNNPNKKQKLSKKPTEETDNSQQQQGQFNLPFANKLNSNFVQPTSSTPAPPIIPPNFQLMPMSLINSMYSWKTPFDYSQQIQNYSNYPQQANSNNQNQQAFLSHQKYATQFLDFIQSKAQSALQNQNFFTPNVVGQNSHQLQTHHHQQQQQQQQYQLNSHHSSGQLPHFTQFNYIEEFKKPSSLATFASFIQEAANSYQTNLFGKPGAAQTNNENSGLDSLKETQLKISESLNMVD